MNIGDDLSIYNKRFEQLHYHVIRDYQLLVISVPGIVLS